MNYENRERKIIRILQKTSKKVLTVYYKSGILSLQQEKGNKNEAYD